MRFLILVVGLPGSGKTLLSRRISQFFNLFSIGTDNIRYAYFRKPTFSLLETERIYTLLFGAAEDAVKKGKSLIVEATFYKKKWRKRIYELANKHGYATILLEVICDKNVILRRIAKRKKSSLRGKNGVDSKEVVLRLFKDFEQIQTNEISSCVDGYIKYNSGQQSVVEHSKFTKCISIDSKIIKLIEEGS